MPQIRFWLQATVVLSGSYGRIRAELRKDLQPLTHSG